TSSQSLARHVTHHSVAATAPSAISTLSLHDALPIFLFDPEESWTIRAAEGHGRVDYTLFEEHRVTGRVKKVFLRGQLIVDGAQWLGKEGTGEFVRRGECGKT